METRSKTIAMQTYYERVVLNTVSEQWMNKKKTKRKKNREKNDRQEWMTVMFTNVCKK